MGITDSDLDYMRRVGKDYGSAMASVVDGINAMIEAAGRQEQERRNRAHQNWLNSLTRWQRFNYYTRRYTRRAYNFAMTATMAIGALLIVATIASAALWATVALWKAILP